MTNSGSPLSASTVINVEEYINAIKEGQIKNYIWDAANSQWVRDPGTIVNISGLQITVDVSGDPVNVSGNWINVSGATVISKISGEAVSISGNAITISGNVVTVSGNWVSVSGATIISKISGESITVSGNAVTVSGNAITVSGNWVNVSGATVISKISGETVISKISGNWVNVSGATIIAKISGETVLGMVRETIVATYTETSAGYTDPVAGYTHTTTKPAYYMWSSIRFKQPPVDTSGEIRLILNSPAPLGAYRTVIDTKSITSGVEYVTLFGSPPSGAPLALVSGDSLTWEADTLAVSGDAIFIRGVIKEVG